MGVTLQENKVSKAVSLTLSLVEQKKTDNVLTDEFQPIQLQIGVKKIPSQQKQIKLKLPHPIAKPDVDVCLFVKDLEKKERDFEPTVLHFQELLSKKGVKNIKEIIPVKSLKTDYKPYESKWNLSNSYDIYLADERVVACLPRLLGKNFYGRKRGPSQVNLLAKDLKGEVDRAISANKFVLSAKGSSSMAVVGHSGMSQNDLTANVLAAVDQISSSIPGSAENIKQLSVKAKSCTSIPLFFAEGAPQDVSITKKRKSKPKVEVDELSTLPDAKVAVYTDGRVLVLKDGLTLKQAEAHDRQSNTHKRKKVAKVEKGKTKSPAKKTKVTVRRSVEKKRGKVVQATRIRKIK